MIKKIEKLKNLGIFYNVASKSDLQDFKKFNLIYGWNGCGKTTLSRLFALLENGSSPAYPELEYRILSDRGTSKQKESFTQPVRVFNQDFVRESSPSLEDASAATNHIFILGKEDRELATKIEKEKAEKTRLSDLLSKDDKKAGIISLQTQKKQVEKTRNTLFTDIAKTIASSRGRAFRDYDRRDAIKVYGALTEKCELNRTELERCLTVVEQKILDKLPTINLYFSGNDTILSVSQQLAEATNQLLARTVQQLAIDRLVQNPDIAGWVSAGLEIHSSHESEVCEYCRQRMPQERANELAKHFNDAHKQFIETIDSELDELRKFYSTVNMMQVKDGSNLYEHLRQQYEDYKSDFIGLRQNALNQLLELGELLKSKKVQTHEAMPSYELTAITVLVDKVHDINQIIMEHNQVSDKFDSTISDAKSKLEKHYVSTIYDNAKLTEQSMASIQLQIEDTESRIANLVGSIAIDEATIRNSKVACKRLNKMLTSFLGRDELSFEDSDNGYLIRRNGTVADQLSEGEKTAISFVYFIICLESHSFNVQDGIVVIDDPISSLDIDAVHRVCALIKTKITANQLIILTHNYEFFCQIKNWFDNDPVIGGRNKDPDENHASYFMIKNPYDAVNLRRVAEISKLDPLLRDYESEYHYLFKKLVTHQEDIVKTNEGTIEAVYQYPNIARKTLECFLSFRVPSKGSLYVKIHKLRSLNEQEITREEIEDIYSFINSHSHLNTKSGLMQFDLTLAKNGEQYIKMVLDVIKKADMAHYADMVKAIS